MNGDLASASRVLKIKNAARATPTSTRFAPIDVYGAEHLLRLISKLPVILVKTDLSPRAVSQLAIRLNELVRYLVEHKADLFLNTYDLYEAASAGLISR